MSKASKAREARKQQQAEAEARLQAALATVPPGVQEPVAFLDIQHTLYSMAMITADLPLDSFLEEVRRSGAIGQVIAPARAAATEQNRRALELLAQALLAFQREARALSGTEDTAEETAFRVEEIQHLWPDGSMRSEPAPVPPDE